MNKGVVVFAHNNRKIDYALMALISGGLAKKNLKVPVSLITDQSTVDWMIESKIYNKAVDVFEHIILTGRPVSNNSRILFDGNNKDTVPFNNINRASVWELTPYERTLLIDSDYFIMSNTLEEYWNIDSDFLIADSINDLIGEQRIGYLDKHISSTGVKMFWATTIMFTKNKKTKKIFDLVEMIRENYSMFSEIYRYKEYQYRNDISFSIAKHIFDGFKEVDTYNLPPVLTGIDKDILVDILEDNRFVFLVSEHIDGKKFPVSIKETDIHIMNKQSIIRNSERLLNLI